MHVDCHIHIALNGQNYKEYQNKILQGDYQPIKDVLKEYKKRNVLYLRDGGDRFGISYIAREFASDEGITYKTPIYAFCKVGSYGSFLGKPINGIDDFKNEFRRLLRYKPDHLKLIVSGIVDFSSYGHVTEEMSFDFDEIYYMVQSAKDENLQVMVHANSSKSVRAAIMAGADTIEHGYFILNEELYLMAEKNVIWIPTLSPLGNLIKYNDKRFEKQMDNIKKIYFNHLECIRKAVQLGVKIAIGSDAGSHKVMHGQGCFNEIEHLKKAGLDDEKIKEIAIKNSRLVLNITND
ncbi:amidohydrolase [Thermoanaerobacter kivui]|uniref:Amidohydrolase n=3 Tax=Thermoanaerobacter kivui TaxID=2325 RepID=A0A097ATI6_THEKI|nr:amidohydrolase [Thermoanaerobacter kivui]